MRRVSTGQARNQAGSWSIPYARAIRRIRDRLRGLGIEPTGKRPSQAGKGPFGRIASDGRPVPVSRVVGGNTMQSLPPNDVLDQSDDTPGRIPLLIRPVQGNQDKLLSRAGIKEIVARIGVQLSEFEISAMINTLDTQKQGKIFLSQLQHACIPHMTGGRKVNVESSKPYQNDGTGNSESDHFMSTKRIADIQASSEESKTAGYTSANERQVLNRFRSQLRRQLGSQGFEATSTSHGIDRSGQEAGTSEIDFDDPFMRTSAYGASNRAGATNDLDRTGAWGRFSLFRAGEHRQSERKAASSLARGWTTEDIELARRLGTLKYAKLKKGSAASSSNSIRQNPLCLSFANFTNWVRDTLGLRLTPIAMRKLFTTLDADGVGFVDMGETLAGMGMRLDAKGATRLSQAQQREEERRKILAERRKELEKSMQWETPSQRQSMYKMDTNVLLDDATLARFGLLPNRTGISQSTDISDEVRSGNPNRNNNPEMNTIDTGRNSVVSESKSTGGLYQQETFQPIPRDSRTQMYRTNKPSQDKIDTFGMNCGTFQEHEIAEKLRARSAKHTSDARAAGLTTTQLNNEVSRGNYGSRSINSERHLKRICAISKRIERLVQACKLPQPPATPRGEQNAMENPNLNEKARQAIMKAAEQRHEAREQAYQEALELDALLKQREAGVARYAATFRGEDTQPQSLFEYRSSTSHSKTSKGSNRQPTMRPSSAQSKRSSIHSQNSRNNLDTNSHLTKHQVRPQSAMSRRSRTSEHVQNVPSNTLFQDSDNLGQYRWMKVYDSHGRPTRKRVDISKIENPALLGTLTHTPRQAKMRQHIKSQSIDMDQLGTMQQSKMSHHHHHHQYDQETPQARQHQMLNSTRTLQIQGTRVGLLENTNEQNDLGMEQTQSKQKKKVDPRVDRPYVLVNGVPTGSTDAMNYRDVFSKHHTRARGIVQAKQEVEAAKKREQDIVNTHSVHRNTLRESLKNSRPASASARLASTTTKPRASLTDWFGQSTTNRMANGKLTMRQRPAFLDDDEESVASSYATTSIASSKSYVPVPSAQRRLRVARPRRSFA